MVSFIKFFLFPIKVADLDAEIYADLLVKCVLFL